jgi:hypothetical protein
MGNSSGSSQETKTLHYYEQLPRSARAALASAKFSWATRGMLKKFEGGRMNARELVKYIQKIDDEMAAKERVKVWGPDYPKIKGTI